MRFRKFLGPRETFAAADRRGLPLVSVIMPTSSGNRDGRLTRAIESILAQTFRNFELVIVDDGSSDGTQATCRAFAVRDPRVVYVRYQQPCGLPAVRVDAAIIESRTAYVALMFDDCLWTVDALESLLATMEERQVDVVHGDMETIARLWHSQTKGTMTVCAELLTCQNTIPRAATLCRRDCFDRFGLFDPHLVMRQSCDWDLWLRALSLGATFAHCNNTVARRQDSPELPVDWDHKTSFAYMTCRRRLNARRTALLPANIDRYDVFDRRALTHYLRNSHEWKVTERLIYEPYFAIHPHLSTAVGRGTDGAVGDCDAYDFADADSIVPHNIFPQCVKERMRVLLVSNVYHEIVAQWEHKLADGHAIVICCTEWQTGLFSPGDIDLLVLFDCAALEMLDVVAAYAAAGVPISYCNVYGDCDLSDDAMYQAAVGESPEYYFGRPGISWNRAQRAIAEQLKRQANAVLTLGPSNAMIRSNLGSFSSTAHRF